MKPFLLVRGGAAYRNAGQLRRVKCGHRLRVCASAYPLRFDGIQPSLFGGWESVWTLLHPRRRVSFTLPDTGGLRDLRRAIKLATTPALAA